MKNVIMLYELEEHKGSVIPLSELSNHIKAGNLLDDKYIGTALNKKGLDLVVSLRQEHYRQDKQVVDTFLESLRYNYRSDIVEAQR